jgi:pyruvate carboxylase
VDDEIAIELEKGKTLVVRCLGKSANRTRRAWSRVFFELNGQPRTIKVPDRSHGATGAGGAPQG